MGARIRPTIPSKEVVQEVSNRTGIAFNVAFNLIYTYFDVLKECVMQGVDVKVGEIGILERKVKNPHYGVIYRDVKNGKELPPKDVPGFYVPFFKMSKKFRKELRDATEFWDERHDEDDDENDEEEGE